MTNQLSAAELDAKVFEAIGWKLIYHGGVPLWSRPDSDEVFGRCLSNNDPEAVRLCLPWLRERVDKLQLIFWHVLSGKHLHACLVSIPGQAVKEIGGSSFAHAICLAVLAVAAREAEQRKEPTT